MPSAKRSAALEREMRAREDAHRKAFVAGLDRLWGIQAQAAGKPKPRRRTKRTLPRETDD